MKAPEFEATCGPMLWGLPADSSVFPGSKEETLRCSLFKTNRFLFAGTPLGVIEFMPNDILTRPRPFWIDRMMLSAWEG